MAEIKVAGVGPITADAGTKLYDVLAVQGLTEGPCGGSGRCGKCRVQILPLCPEKDEEKRFFSAEELKNGWRLACLHEVCDGMEIRLPRAEQASELLIDGAAASFLTDGDEGFGIAVDIGTTTVAACLIERKTGRQLSRAACLNSQRSFGQDVITRIDYAMQNEDGLRRMQEAICGDLRMLAEQLCRDAGIETASIAAYTVAANNVMTHIFTGADPAGLAAYPFTPAYEGARDLPAAELNLPAAAGARVWCLPAVSAYVGGDITAGMLTCDLANLSGNVLFIDIGTNGEMVLSREGSMFSCSCAAGPALEGMDIRCGMRAAQGAVEETRILWKDGKPRWELHTIGEQTACGLCGSGLLSAVKEMIACGAIGENGRLQPHPLVSTVEGKRRCILDEDNGIYLSQQDIRQVQLAKGAILAGVEILLKEAELTPEQLNRVLVAGQFGAHLTPESLVGAGLLPGSLADRIHYVGNTSLAGATACLLSREMREKSLLAAEHVRYLELSAYEGYEKALISAMRFVLPPLGRYDCSGAHRNAEHRPEEGVSPEAWHFSPAALAEEARHAGACGWALLPFCYTLLAEALGAEPVLTDQGARISKLPYERADQLPPEPDYDFPRFHAMEEAMELLRGEDLIYQMDGPMTVLSQLIPMGRLFVQLRRSDELLRRAEDWVCGYAGWAASHGAKVLSFADPVATLDLLGEKHFRTLYLPSIQRVLRRLQQENPETVIYLCGKMTQSLLDVEAVKPRLMRCDAAAYGDALREFSRNPGPEMVGHFCVHRLAEQRTTLTLLSWA
jgi:uncharacterized 2Fe-2S/4Fe-4S cluster protein (DUF4445 family)